MRKIRLLLTVVVFVALTPMVMAQDDVSYSRATMDILKDAYNDLYPKDYVQEVLDNVGKLETQVNHVDSTTVEVVKKQKIVEFINGNPNATVKKVIYDTDEFFNPNYQYIFYELTTPVTSPTSPIGGR